jgi:hypothetical protein
MHSPQAVKVRYLKEHLKALLCQTFNFKLDSFTSEEPECFSSRQPLLELKYRQRFCPLSWSSFFIHVQCYKTFFSFTDFFWQISYYVLTQQTLLAYSNIWNWDWSLPLEWSAWQEERFKRIIVNVLQSMSLLIWQNKLEYLSLTSIFSPAYHIISE